MKKEKIQAIVAIVGSVVAIVALIPAFGEWLYPHEPVSSSHTSVSTSSPSKQAMETITPNALETSTTQADILATAHAQATATSLSYILPTAYAVRKTAVAWSINSYSSFSTDMGDWMVGYKDYPRGTIDASISNDKYRWDIHAIQSITWPVYYKYDTFRDLGTEFYWACDGQNVSGPVHSDYGLLFDSSNENYYTFSIRDTGVFAVHTIYEDEWENLTGWINSSFIQAGEANRMAVIANKNKYSFFINGQYVIEVFDSTFQGEKVGLQASLRESESGVFEFDNCELRSP